MARILTSALLLILVLSRCAVAQTLLEHLDVDERGRPVHHVGPTGLSTDLIYDGLDRIVRVDGPNDTARFGYDTAGRHAWTEDGVAEVHYEFDPFDRLIGTRYVIARSGAPTVQRTMRYRYDDLGRIDAITLEADYGVTDYAVALARDLEGRLVSFVSGDADVSFTYTNRNGAAIVTRTLPSGVVTRIASDPVGLPLKLEHRTERTGKVFEASEYSYRLADGTISVATTRGGDARQETFDLWGHSAGDRPLPPAEIRVNADQRVMISSVGGGTRYYLSAPIAPGHGLVVELDRNGDLSSAFFAAENLSIEHRIGTEPVLFLETPGSSAADPLYARATTGQSMALDGDIVAVEPGQVAVAFPPRDAPSTQASPVDWSGVMDNAKLFEKEVKFLHALDTGTKYEGDVILGAIRGVNTEFGDYIRRNLPEDREILDLLDEGTAIYTDLTAITSPQTSLKDKIVMHGLLGKTSQYYAGKVVKDIVKKRGGGFITGKVAGTTVDISYTLARIYPRGHGWDLGDTVEIAEDVTDLGLSLATYGFAMAATQNPAIAEASAEFAVAAAGQIRMATQDVFIESERAYQTRRGLASRGQTGRFINAGAMALLRGNVDDFFAKFGPGDDPADIFTTVITGDRRHRSAFINDRNRSYRTFQSALRTGNALQVSSLLETDPHIRKAMKLAGSSDASIDSLARHLRARDDTKVVAAGIAPEIRRPGGVDLTETGSARLDLGNLTGAVFDPETGRIALAGDGDVRVTPIDPEMLAVALVAAYRGDDIRFSLDPVDPRDPRTWQEAVYYPADLLTSTTVGQLLYEADLELKLLSFGAAAAFGAPKEIVVTGTTVTGPVQVWFSNRYQTLDLSPRSPPWPGYRSVPELGLRSEQGTEPLRVRQWIVIEDVKLRETEGAISFGDVRLGVRARRQVIDAQGRLVDVASDDPASSAFAAMLTEHFDAAADSVPAFARLKEFAKIVVFAKWLAESEVDVDLDWAIDLVNARSDSVRQVSTLDWVRADRDQIVTEETDRTILSTTTRQISISGGVDFTAAVQAMPADAALTDLRRDVLEANADRNAPIFDLEATAKRGPRLVTVVPITPGGRGIWDVWQAWRDEGLQFTLDKEGRLVGTMDLVGNRARYVWDSDGVSRALRWNPLGGSSSSEKIGDGLLIERTRPGRAALSLTIDPNNVSIFAGDHQVRSYSIDRRGKLIRIVHPDTGIVGEIELGRGNRVLELRRHHSRLPAPQIVRPSRNRGPNNRDRPLSRHRIDTEIHGIAMQARFNRNGSLSSARIGDHWFAELAFDRVTGLGSGKFGDTRLEISAASDDLTRLTLAIPVR